MSARLTNAIIQFATARGLDPGFLWEGLGVDRSILTDLNAWVSAETFNTIMARLRERTGDPRIMEQVGLIVTDFKSFGFIHVAAFLLKDPSKVINRLVAGMLEALTKTSRMQVLEVTPRETIIIHHVKPEYPAIPKDTCYFLQGCFSALPKTWGLRPAHVTEYECQAEGALACRYRVSWPALTLRHRIGLWIKGAKLHGELVRLLDEQNAEIEARYEEAMRRTTELQQAYFRIMESLMEALDTKDWHTKNHSRSVSAFAVEIARADGLPEVAIEEIRKAALLHDIGKIGVPERILHKPGPLTPEEMAVIRLHPVLGEKILQPLSFLGSIIQMVAQEHERFDGAGYPRGFQGSQIHRGAQIIAVADALDAMVSMRPYRKSLPFEEAATEIQRCAGTQFDPSVVEAFTRAVPRLEAIYRHGVSHHEPDSLRISPA